MDNNYRSPMEPVINEIQQNIMRTPFGNVQSIQPNFGPPLPPPPLQMQQYSNYGNNYGQLPYGGSYGGYGHNNYGSSGLFGMGSVGMGNYGGMGAFNRYGSLNTFDPETRFIQMAEESSRPALQSIESLVSAVANIAAMLDSTFFAITSSFRAILNVAANFSRLRGIFSQFWQTFALFRGLIWMYKKCLYWLNITNVDPSTLHLSEAFEAAKIDSVNGVQSFPRNNKTHSHWPVIAFMGFIFSAPYLVMKLLNNLTTSVIEETKDPRHWVHPIKSKVLYDFLARNSSELTIQQDQQIYIAPKEIQQSQKLLNTGWVLGTLDGVTSGIIPLTYVEKINKITNNISRSNLSKNINNIDNSVSDIFSNPLEETLKTPSIINSNINLYPNSNDNPHSIDKSHSNDNSNCNNHHSNDNRHLNDNLHPDDKSHANDN